MEKNQDIHNIKRTKLEDGTSLDCMICEEDQSAPGIINIKPFYDAKKD